MDRLMVTGVKKGKKKEKNFLLVISFENQQAGLIYYSVCLDSDASSGMSNIAFTSKAQDRKGWKNTFRRTFVYRCCISIPLNRKLFYHNLSHTFCIIQRQIVHSGGGYIFFFFWMNFLKFLTIITVLTKEKIGGRD